MSREKFNILWETFIAAVATGCLSTVLDFNPILIGLIVGLIASIVCYFYIRSYENLTNSKDKEDENQPKKS